MLQKHRVLCGFFTDLLVCFFSSQGQCECRLHVEGPACDRCKPLYWNLSPDTPDGCSSEKHYTHTHTHLTCFTSFTAVNGAHKWTVCFLSPADCECNVAGTVSGVAECAQVKRICRSSPEINFQSVYVVNRFFLASDRKLVSVTASQTPAVEPAPRVKTVTTTCRSRTTSAARVSVHLCLKLDAVMLPSCIYICVCLCLGCQCDIGGSAGQSCGERNGRCRCRPNVEGPKCNVWV